MCKFGLQGPQGIWGNGRVHWIRMSLKGQSCVIYVGCCTDTSQFYHTCIPALVVDGEWFCDDICRTNSGFHSKKHHM